MHVKVIARALADALLSGEPDLPTACERCVQCLGRNPRWLRGLVTAMVSRYGQRWVPMTRAELMESILEHPPLLRAVSNGEHLPVRRYFVLSAALAHCAIPDLPTTSDLARWLDIAPDELDWLARVRPPAHSDHYAYRWLPKRVGGWRLIEMPKARLRAIQRKLLHGLLEFLPPHEAAHGFRARHSILTNAQQHVGQRVVLKMDLQDFFLSLHGNRVAGLFRAIGYPESVASDLARLCTNRTPPLAIPSAEESASRYDQPCVDWHTRKRYSAWHLPQGAPTSPALANLCAFALDLRLQAAAEQFDANYSRYADDLTFSGGSGLLRGVDRFIALVGAIASDEGLRVNFHKTRVMTSSQRQEVTGVIVNRRINISRHAFDELKAILSNCGRLGPHAQNRQGVQDFRAHLAGRVAHVAMLNPARGHRLQLLLERIDWESRPDILS